MEIKLHKNTSPWLKYPAFSLLFFTIIILLIRIFLRGHVLLLDEAEQVIMAQNMVPGYPGQPPLYTWLQYIFFKVFGVNLFCVALLKCSLLFACLYSFHLICRIHCKHPLLAWCATLSWALIPPIGLDLIKDNTHSILVLLTACLTWYWFITPNFSSKLLWYCILGCLIGLGQLSKFNYILFLAILLISATSIKEYRQRLITPYLFISLLIAALIISPYLWWLLGNATVGLSSAYKLNITGNSFWWCMMKLIKVTLLFAAPALLILAIFFPVKSWYSQPKIANKLLFRYHILCLPFLMIFVSVGGFRNFESRWLIPILFLCPIFYLSQVRYRHRLELRILSFLKLCLITQFVFFVILIYSNHSGEHKRKQIPLNQIIQGIKQNSDQIDYIVSDSYWLLGNLVTTLSFKNVHLIHPAHPLNLPKGKSLIVWKNVQIPSWVNYIAQTHLLNELKLIEDPQNNTVIGGHASIAY